MKAWYLTERESAERRGIAGPLTSISENNQVWSADFKGKFRLLSREYCHPFTLTDNHSRYLLSCRGTDRESEPFVRHCLTEAFPGVRSAGRSENR
ncbi:hypothetical protein OIPHN260_03300 [Enterobacter roggenkampii]|uniref:Transposase n=1 Tax=Enterobacter roggenkampii TaxID=1812935 RepID=A0AAU9C8A0_9ENTR|nr:hypothetical protein OIPHN260_03300 [Enterobacter roggenkampii]